MKHKLAAATLAVGLVAGGAIVAEASVPAKNGKFYACTNEESGAVRLVGKRFDCWSGWEKVHWNGKGRRGKHGRPGRDANTLVYTTLASTFYEEDPDRNQVILTSQCSGTGSVINAEVSVQDMNHTTRFRSHRITDNTWELLVRYEDGFPISPVTMSAICIG